MSGIALRDLVAWCRIRVEELEDHPQRRVPLRIVPDRETLGEVMARALTDEVAANNAAGRETRAIVPCGPMGWFEPFGRIVRDEGLSLRRLTVFHMDECLDWQGRELPRGHPFNFRSTMQRVFYDPVPPELAVPLDQRFWPDPSDPEEIASRIAEAPISILLGGLGQDGHLAFNQARRDPFRPVSIEELRRSTVRIQSNGLDTVIALSQRTLGTAYQLVPPMSITLGMRECLSARRIRIFTDTGAWKQTALRVTLFGPVTSEYPATLLQEHPDALVTATLETASHPIAEHPEWDLGLADD